MRFSIFNINRLISHPLLPKIFPKALQMPWLITDLVVIKDFHRTPNLAQAEHNLAQCLFLTQISNAFVLCTFPKNTTRRLCSGGHCGVFEARFMESWWGQITWELMEQLKALVHQVHSQSAQSFMLSCQMCFLCHAWKIGRVSSDSIVNVFWDICTSCYQL